MRKNPLVYGNWLATLSMAALTLVWLLVFFVPGMKAARDMRADIKAKRTLISQAGQLDQAFQSSQDEQRKIAAFVQSRLEQIPLAGDVSELFGRITAVAGGTGAVMTRFEPEPAVNYERLARIPLSLGYQATLDEAWQFLHALEELPGPVWIEQLRLKAESEAGQDLHCELKLAVFADKSALSD